MTLDELGVKYGTDKSQISHFYTAIYEGLFHRLKDEPIRLLEIGVQFGYSLKMWHDWFTAATIVGMDAIDNRVDFRDYPRIKFVQGNQSNVFDLARVVDAGKFDIIIDDGSHESADIVASLEFLKDHLNPGGIYVIEDLHTCKNEEPWTLLMSYIRKDINQENPKQCGNAALNDSEWKSVTFLRSLAILVKK